MSTDSSRPLGDTPGYGQLCSVGFALDTIGDRWTILVLRDLARTPLRFRDLQALNPGISPNLLTLRLRNLEEAGLVERRPAPEGSGHLYALTDETRHAVVPMLSAVAEFGAFLIDQMPPEDLMAMDLPTVLTRQMQLNGHFALAKASPLVGTFVFDLGGIRTHLTLSPGEFHASAEDPGGDPTAVITFFPPTVMMRIMGRATTVEAAEEAGLLAIEGDRAAARAVIELLSFEQSPEARAEP